MPFGKTYAEIKELILHTALDSGMCRDIVRRSGLWPGASAGSSVPVNVLTQTWIVEPWADILPTFHPNDRYGIMWNPPGGFPDIFDWWPTGDAVYTTVANLDLYVYMRNVIYVGPDTPHPDLNVYVQASTDGGATWDYPTTQNDPADWLYSGCNANLGNWPETVEDARGGCIASAWQPISNPYRVSDVNLRWGFFKSPASDGSVYDPTAHDWGALRFGYSTIQVK